MLSLLYEHAVNTVLLKEHARWKCWSCYTSHNPASCAVTEKCACYKSMNSGSVGPATQTTILHSESIGHAARTTMLHHVQ